MSQTQNKPIVLITGASSGFGKACAKKYNLAGYPVILVARRLEKLTALAASLNSAYPIHIAKLDVTNKSEIKEFVKNLPDRFKKVGVLVNNAGLAVGSAPIHETIEDDFERMIDTNIKGLVNMSRQIVPIMVANNSGHIVNIGSIAGSWPYPGGNVYGGTKAFVQQFSRGLRADLLGKNIRVTNIEPGMAETEFSNVRFKGDGTKADNVYAGVKPLVADDIAETVFFATSMPAHANINSLEVMPTCQAWGALAVAR
jgi:3-hydroxy acid dehydrogenase / malonic semialdehyde reductase